MKTESLLRRQIGFFNIFKWFLASVFIGAVVGVFNAMFLKLLSAALDFTNSFPLYFVSLPIGLYVVNYLARKIQPEHKDFSTNDAIAAINEKRPMSLISAAKAFFLPIITIACGGSAGKESPCADVGAGLASFCSKLFSFNKQERRKLMICGVSAGFAGVFGVPISGALFGLEVLSVGTVFYEVMFPAFIAGITSFQVTHLLGVEYIYHPMTLQALHLDSSLLHVFLSGIFFGLVGLILIETLKLTQIIFRFISMKLSTFWSCFIAASLLILLALLTSPAYLGLSMERVDAILSGEQALTFGFAYKIIATSLTFAGGGVGGIITPILFIGANAGYFFAHVLGLDTVTFAALGIVSVLAGVANTPLAASVMAIELFGSSIAPYAAVSCIVSFLITGRRSIFNKQQFAFDKNLSEDEETPQEKQSIKQLEKTLKKKNFILSSVKHLIPEIKELELPLVDKKRKSKKRKKKNASAENSAILAQANQVQEELFPTVETEKPAENSDGKTAAENKENAGPKKKKKFSLLSHLVLPLGDEEEKPEETKEENSEEIKDEKKEEKQDK